VSELPSSWIEAVLEDVCNVIRGITFPASVKEPNNSPTNVCCLRTSNVQREVDWHDIYFVPQDYVKRNDQYVQLGDILMSMANSYELVGKVAVVRDVPYTSAFGAFLAAIRPKVGVHGQYLFHLLRTVQVQSELRRGSSQTVNIANISVNSLSSIRIPLASFHEQERIANKLDVLLKKVDNCREKLERVPFILKRFRRAILAAATSGALTEDWREKNRDYVSENFVPAQLIDQETSLQIQNNRSELPRVPDGWEWSYIGNIAEVKGGKRLPKGESLEAEDTGQPYVRATNLKQGTVMGKMYFVPHHLKSKIKRYIVKSGDAYITIVGACIGDAGTIPAEYDGANLTENAARIRGTDICSSSFIANWLRASFCQNEIQSSILSAAQGKLALFRIEQMPIAIPPMDEQAEIVRQIEKFFALADRLDARYTTARKQVDQLTPSLLAKAFRGELVEQYPNDEPASVLLERIRSERSTRVPTLRRRIVSPLSTHKTQILKPEPFPPTTGPVVLNSGIIPDRILAVMQTGRDYSRAEITAASGISDTEWTWAIKQLKEKGKVKQKGERRGAKYARR